MFSIVPVSRVRLLRTYAVWFTRSVAPRAVTIFPASPLLLILRSPPPPHPARHVFFIPCHVSWHLNRQEFISTVSVSVADPHGSVLFWVAWYWSESKSKAGSNSKKWAVEAQNKMELRGGPWRVCKSVVADLNHFDGRSRIRISIEVNSRIRLRSGSALKSYGSASTQVTQHWSEYLNIAALNYSHVA